VRDCAPLLALAVGVVLVCALRLIETLIDVYIWRIGPLRERFVPFGDRNELVERHYRAP
jgi:hypothetical protein